MLKFSDPATFAKVAAAVSDSYQPGANNTVGVDVRPYIEAPISQSGVNSNFSLSEGICVAMSQHVAKFFLEHPNFKGDVTAKLLDLTEFDEAQANLESGSNLFNQGKYNQAVNAFKSVVQAYPKDYLGQTKAAILEAARSTDYNQALQLIKSALKQHPNDPVLLALGGQVLARQKSPSTSSPQTSKTPENVETTVEPAARASTAYLSITSLGLKPKS
jgi:tetratricopeptide (TPR) repeat protein